MKVYSETSLNGLSLEQTTSIERPNQLAQNALMELLIQTYLLERTLSTLASGQVEVHKQ